MHKDKKNILKCIYSIYYKNNSKIEIYRNSVDIYIDLCYKGYSNLNYIFYSINNKEFAFNTRKHYMKKVQGIDNLLDFYFKDEY